MHIHASSKLMEKMNQKNMAPISQPNDDPFFSWHGHVITIGRKNTLVLLNEQTKCIAIVWGLKAKDFKNLDEVIKRAIGETWLYEGIDLELIEKYLVDGGDFTYGKNQNRSLTSRMTQATQLLKLWEIERFLSDSIYQSYLGALASRTLVSLEDKKGYFYPYERLFETLEKVYGSPIFRYEAVVLEGLLDWENGTALRKIQVPLSRNFEALADVMKDVFGGNFFDEHSFLFYDNQTFEPVLEVINDYNLSQYAMTFPRKIEPEVFLKEILPEHRTFLFRFAEHEVQLTIVDVVEEQKHGNSRLLEMSGDGPKKVSNPEHLSQLEYLNLSIRTR